MISISSIVEHCKVLTFQHLDHCLTKRFVLAGNGWVSSSRVMAALGCVLEAKRMYGTMV